MFCVFFNVLRLQVTKRYTADDMVVTSERDRMDDGVDVLTQQTLKVRQGHVYCSGIELFCVFGHAFRLQIAQEYATDGVVVTAATSERMISMY